MLLINEVRVLFVGIRVRRNNIRDCSESTFAKLGVLGTSFVETYYIKFHNYYNNL